MEGIFVLFVILSFVIPIAIMGNQRGRRTRADYGGGATSVEPSEPTPASALASWGAPSEDDESGGSASSPGAPPAGPRIGGHPLTCGHCGSVDFEEREAQLNTAMATFFNVDWANRTATCFVCLRCGHIEWFLL